MFKIAIATALVASSDALKIEHPWMTRRAVFVKTASLAPLVPLAAFAATPKLKQPEDAAVYKRADEGTDSAARAIERAKKGQLVDGTGATCSELDAIIGVDREAIAFEKDKLVALGSVADEGEEGALEMEQVEATKDKLQAQLTKLTAKRKEKGCGTDAAKLKQASDFEIYKQADEGSLSAANVIERAKRGQLVDGSGATCKQLETIITVDNKAIKFEKEKLYALGVEDVELEQTDPATKKVLEAEGAIEQQVEKLTGLQKKKCL